MSSLRRKLPESFPFDDITWNAIASQLEFSKRQREIVELILCDMENTEIALHLGIKVGTLRSHLKIIYGRTATHRHKSLILKIFNIASRLK